MFFPAGEQNGDGGNVRKSVHAAINRSTTSRTQFHIEHTDDRAAARMDEHNHKYSADTARFPQSHTKPDSIPEGVNERIVSSLINTHTPTHPRNDNNLTN